MTIDEVREMALSLPEVDESPHHHYSSFRVAGKIIATVPPDESYVNIFVDEFQTEMMLEIDPVVFEKLMWGKSAMGLKVHFSKADIFDVNALLKSAWERKAPRSMQIKK